jgi:hypothetical protein
MNHSELVKIRMIFHPSIDRIKLRMNPSDSLSAQTYYQQRWQRSGDDKQQYDQRGYQN